MVNWLPTRYTEPLSKDFTSDGDKLLRVVDKYWKSQETDNFKLDDWQRWILRAILETYPPGHDKAGQLRYRQVVISLGRQNGKSVLAAILGFYGLHMHVQGPLVIGLAYSSVQANIVYNRVRYTIKNVPGLDNIYKATGTRGITRKDAGAAYEVRASVSEALQGLPISLGLIDELHIVKPEVWQAVVNGQRSRSNALLIGITTAGDDNSELLKSLYKQGEDAIAGNQERFGYFVWEAPEGSDTLDPAAIAQANPAIACGRVDIATVLTDLQGQPEVDRTRYTLNRFVASTGSWLPMSYWHIAGAEINAETVIAGQGPIVWGIDRSEGWGYGTITASQKRDGIVYTELVALLHKPTVEQLLEVCLRLRAHGNCIYVMDTKQLADLAAELKMRGLVTYALNSMEVATACETAYALIVQRKMQHSNDWRLSQQVARGIRKNIGDAWAISRQKSSVEIDSLMATIFGLYIANRENKPIMQLF